MKLPAFDHLRPVGRISGLIGSSRALFLLRRCRPFIALSESEEEARLLFRECSFFAALLGIPSPLFLPAPEQKLTASRLTFMEGIETGREPSIVGTVEAALTPVWEAKTFKREALHLQEGEALDADFLGELLDEMGYRRSLLVADSGEYAFREKVIDIFPPASKNPVRLERSGRIVSSLRFFDINTQRSFRDVRSIDLLPIKEPGEGRALFEIMNGSTVAVCGDPGSSGDSLPSFVTLEQSIDDGANGAGLQPVEGLGITRRERREKGEGLDALGVLLTGLSQKYRILIVTPSEGEAERVGDLLAEAGSALPSPPGQASAPGLTVTVSPGSLSGGFFDSAGGTLVVTAAEIFGSTAGRVRPLKQSRVDQLISSLDDLSPGDTVVHVDHGIGRYVGLKKVEGDEFHEDLLELEYAGGARLYLPPSQIGKMRRHHGGGISPPPLDRIGGKSWRSAKARVEKKVREMADELLQAAAARERAEGFAFKPDGEHYREFVSAFPYEETADQLTSLEEIRRDMESPRPMDRLLCGDVGYGKTEVAMRAAFKAAADRRQVAIMVPTTLLAEQHFENFRSRFAPFPVKVDVLSRFSSAAQQREIVRSLGEGETDIVIGTQRLLGKGVTFPRLGLLIIDEEHKFGVADKEKLKKMKEGVDVLTLTATPIPRTLHIALTGLRSLSLIETPPEERMAVKSIVTPFSERVIQEALDREFRRRGQVFFVHNRIESIFRRASLLGKIFPERRIAVAHGRMSEKEMDGAMHRFHGGEADILLCTAIVSAGLDIPRANTIVIERADTFGLADLYQLKGRVGRGSARAFSYFLTPPPEELTPEAEQRLDAIRELSYLGAGFRLAMKDLELRGAGSILSAEQSGNIETIGYDLYVELLREAVADLKGEKVVSAPEPVMHVDLPAGLTDDYLDDPTLRFTVHRKITAAGDVGALNDLRRELRDRFGPPPVEVTRLLDLAELKVIARRLGLARFEENARRFQVVFGSETAVTDTQLLLLPERSEESLRFLPEGGFEVDLRKLSWEETFQRLKKLLAFLEPGSA